MGIVEEIEAVLDLANRPANVATLVVIPDGEDRAIVRCDPPGHWAGPHVLSQEVTPVLEAAGLGSRQYLREKSR